MCATSHFLGDMFQSDTTSDKKRARNFCINNHSETISDDIREM